MCSIECPAGVDISKIIIEARAQLAQQTGFTAAELALSHNRRLSVLAGTFAPVSNWVLSFPLVRWMMEKTIGLDRTRKFPHFDRGSFFRKAQYRIKEPLLSKASIDKVVYFVDSYANWNDHALGFAVLDVLKKLNVDVVVPKQRPAPLPAYVYGNLRTARRDIEYNLAQITPFVRRGCKVICSEPSAALCLKDEMRLLNDTEEARLVSENTFELMDYLKTLVLQQENRLFDGQQTLQSLYAGKRFGYHAPCHLKALRLAGHSIELLRHCGLDISDINGGCCGLAGTAGMQKKHHELCDAIGVLLIARINECNPDIIVTECAACKMQIEHLTGKTVIHPVKLLAMAV
jgi:Fe-S oxidoreductase